MYSAHQCVLESRATERRGGQGGIMTPGPMDFWGPMRLPMGFRKAQKGPIKWHLEMSMWDPLFGDHLIWTEETVRIPVKNFFFWDRIIIWTKLRHCFRLFWSSQNLKSVIFQLAPGLRSALGTPAGERRPNCNTRHLLVLSCFFISLPDN